MAEGGLMARAIADAPAPGGDDARQRPLSAEELLGAGPRAAGHPADLALVLEAVREGYLLHHGGPRLMTREDDDLALLAGDRLYALALERLAAAGDLEAVAALSDVIALSARAHAAAEDELAAAVWRAGASELAWGPSTALEAAKAAAREGAPGATALLLDAARRAPDDLAPSHA